MVEPVDFYDTELFGDSLPSTLICAICTNVVNDAHSVSPGDEHVFCQPCIKGSLAQSKLCPSCRKPTARGAPFPNGVVGVQVRNLRVRCPGKARGCSWGGVQPELEQHWDGCRFNRVQCASCATRVPYLQQAQHAGTGVCP